MSSVFEFTLTHILVGFAAISALLLVTYCKWHFNYWKLKKLFCPEEPSFPFGNLKNPLNNDLNIVGITKNFYDKLKSQGHKHGGVYLTLLRVYIPVDPEYIKNVLQTDFTHFPDRGFYYNEKSDPLSANVFTVELHKWRKIRSKLLPAFTSSRMKMIFDVFLRYSSQMHDALNKICENGTEVDVNQIFSCYTTDAISSHAFGTECNSFKYPDAPFKKQAYKILVAGSRMRFTKLLFAMAFPKIARWLGIVVAGDKETTDFFISAVKESLETRKKDKVPRNDILETLIQSVKKQTDLQEMENTTEYDQIITDITAQLFIIFLSGYDSSKITMNYCLYELSLNTNIQEKLRREINLVLTKFNGEITYDAIMDMKYMKQVIDETLRKYPPAYIVSRMCREDYKVPDTDVVIDKGIVVMVPVFAIHHDPDYYPEPDKFDPERFSEENKKKILPFTYLPFSDGPRNCIGLRFAFMQIAVALTVLFKNFKFSLSENTTVPIGMNLNFPLLTPKVPVILKVEKIE